MLKRSTVPHNHAASSSDNWEQMESSFLKCLHEIERCYVHLAKGLRIRVEKWVEKLVATGNNTTWRKHRNAYARLLLNMVITRNLSEPFNLLPPDGPLPSFPFHVKPMTRDLLGPHESSFWRGMYERLQDSPKENVPKTGLNGLSFGDVTSTPSLHNNFDGGNHIPQSHSPHHQYGTDFDTAGTNTVNAFGINREINNLNLLIREQNERIQLLEQQLHEERVKHELQIQRLHYTHRSEINRILESANGGVNSTVNTVRWSHELDNHIHSHRDDNVFAKRDIGGRLSNSFDQQRRTTSSPYRSHSLSALTPQRSQSPSSIHISRARRYSQENHDSQRRSAEFVELPEYAHNAVQHTQDNTYQEMVHRASDGLLHQFKDQSLQHVDIVPFPKIYSQSMHTDASTIDHAVDSSSIYHNKINSEVNELLRVDNVDLALDTQAPVMPHIGNADDDFLSYLDEFQSELKKVQGITNSNDPGHLSDDSLHH